MMTAAVVTLMLLAVTRDTLGRAALEALALKSGTLEAGALAHYSAAFSVLGRFQITYFDVFLCFISHISCPAVLG
jgi:hypothetical protein